MMKLVLVLLYLSPILAHSDNDSAIPIAPLTTYDQRQTGKFNIHISVKDVQFLSLSDSVGSVGDYDSYPDYDYDGDGDYDESHLTVNPIFGLLGTGGSTMKPKPTSKPTTTTPASTTITSIQVNDTKPESHESKDKMPIKESTIVVIKPTQPHNINNASETISAAAIDYEEIPVEVQYYRNSNSNNNNNNHQQQQKVQINSRHAPTRYRPRPSVQIIGDNTESRNVKIMENDRPAVKICSSSEFRDKYGRCRLRSRRRSVQGGVL